MTNVSSAKHLKTEDKWSRIAAVTMKSDAMQEFFTRICRLTDENRAVVLAVPNFDRLELRSLFLKVAERQGHSQHVRIINNERLPSPADLEHDDAVSLLFLDGEHLPEHLQWAIAENRMNFPIILLTLKSADGDRAVRSVWSSIFRDVCNPETLVWPAWRERQADYADVLDEIIRLVRLPHDAGSLKLSDQARELLLAAEYEGANHLEWTINQAVRRLLATPDTGPLEVKHLVPRQRMRILSSHRSVPALAVVKP